MGLVAQTWTPMCLLVTSPKALTPYHGTSNLNCTFKVSQISPFTSGTQQDAATIVAEVLLLLWHRHLNEFCHMCEPKVTKLKEEVIQCMQNFVFHSWHMDILVHISRIINWIIMAAIQLIKDQTQDSAHHEVEFQLDLCGGDINYQDLLEHLSITFQGGQ